MLPRLFLNFANTSPLEMSRLVPPLPKIHSNPNLQFLWMWLYLENRVFADGIKFGCSHTGLRWALRPVTSVFTRERGEFGYRDTDEPQGRKPGKEKQRLEQCRCQGTLPGGRKRQGRIFPGVFRGRTPCQHFDLGLRASKTENTFLLF